MLRPFTVQYINSYERPEGLQIRTKLIGNNLGLIFLVKSIGWVVFI